MLEVEGQIDTKNTDKIELEKRVLELEGVTTPYFGC